MQSSLQRFIFFVSVQFHAEVDCACNGIKGKRVSVVWSELVIIFSLSISDSGNVLKWFWKIDT